VNLRRLISGAPWSVLRQAAGKDRAGLGPAVRSGRSKAIGNRLTDADRVVTSICPYCAVGCGQRLYVKDEALVHIEGDPDSPISRGHLCPKGASTMQFVTSPRRVHTVKYRRPYGTAWEELPLDEAMDMIAERVIATRRTTWEFATPEGLALNRTRGIASLGGATLDNEENYLMKKLYTGLGIISVENQARL